MKLLRAAIAILPALFAAACLPVTSKTPVGTTVGLGADDALYGTWKGRSEGEKTDVYFHFLADKNDGVLAVIVGTGDTEGDGSAGFYMLRTAKLGANRFINVVKIHNSDGSDEDLLKEASIPVLYSFAKNHTLTLYLLDEDKTAEAIRAGLIAGTIQEDNFGDVQITADAAALDAFMATPEAAKLFKVFIVLKRAK